MSPDPEDVAEVYSTALALSERMGKGRAIRILRCLRSWHALESAQRRAVLALCWPVRAAFLWEGDVFLVTREGAFRLDGSRIEVPEDADVMPVTLSWRGVR